MMNRILTVGAAGVALIGIAACQDLNVPNTNDPDRNRALANPADVEALVGSQFLVFFNRLTNRTAVYNPVPLMADEMTGTYANDGSLEISSEPRVEFNNNSEGLVFAMSTFPYKEFNSMVASANDVLNAIDDGLVIETQLGTGRIPTQLADNTFRTQVFSHFIKGLGMGYLSLYFDSAFVVDQDEQRRLADNSLDAKDLQFQPYQEVRDSAIKSMERAIQMSLLPSDFDLPPLVYFRTDTINDEELARIGHTYIARFLVYGARTPAERAALDWDRVLVHLNNGITADFVLPLNNPLLVAGYLSRISNSGSFSARADYKMIGPADQPGPRPGCPDCGATTTAYQNWISKPLAQRTRFDIITPDRRITGAGGPQTTGTYFQYRTNDVFEPTRGLYHFSAYQWRRNTSSSSGNIIWLSKAEVDLMKAEAYYFKGDLATAATFVNLTRANGALEPIGPEGDQSADCVPRRTDGTCGDLYDAIVYERTVEGAGQDALRTYFDSRGLGRLVEGTIIQLPISVDEAVALERPIYTYGGVGRPGSVPKCTTVTITCHPSYP